jgi:hypothetical protein
VLLRGLLVRVASLALHDSIYSSFHMYAETRRKNICLVVFTLFAWPNGSCACACENVCVMARRVLVRHVPRLSPRSSLGATRSCSHRPHTPAPCPSIPPQLHTSVFRCHIHIFRPCSCSALASHRHSATHYLSQTNPRERRPPCPSQHLSTDYSKSYNRTRPSICAHRGRNSRIRYMGGGVRSHQRERIGTRLHSSGTRQLVCGLHFIGCASTLVRSWFLISVMGLSHTVCSILAAPLTQT